MPAPKAYVSPTQRLVHQPKPVGRPSLTPKSDRVSTFPARFIPLRDRLFNEAKASPDFLSTVFTRIEGEAPTDDEIMQSVENRLFSLIHKYPDWYGLTKDADVRTARNRRAYGIQRGLIQPEDQPEALRRHQQERREFFDERDRRSAEVSEAVS